MAPKNHKKLKGRAKEKMVTSKLMAISLIVDEYIYQNKPISLLDAVKFDEEITSLRIECKQDTRSLQVVEKLKIFMKGIIKEQSTDRVPDSSSYVTDTSVDKNPLKKIISEDVEVNNTGVLQTDTATGLFINKDRQNSELNNISRDISIDIYPVRNFGNTDIKLVGIDTPTKSNSKLNDESEKSTCTSKNINIDKANVLANPTKEKERAKPDLVALTSSDLKKPPEQEITSPIKENQKNDKITTGIIDKRTPKKNKITSQNIIKPKTKRNINKEPRNKYCGENKPKRKPVKKSQVDFSWVENLKYVREVSPDEHTDLQIEDNFWTNLSLPGIIWNSNEFD